jgi:hypothetical protein
MFIKITPGFCNGFWGICENYTATIPQAKLSHGISDFLAKHQNISKTLSTTQ